MCRFCFVFIGFRLSVVVCCCCCCDYCYAYVFSTMLPNLCLYILCMFNLLLKLLLISINCFFFKSVSPCKYLSNTSTSNSLVTSQGDSALNDFHLSVSLFILLLKLLLIYACHCSSTVSLQCCDTVVWASLNRLGVGLLVVMIWLQLCTTYSCR